MKIKKAGLLILACAAVFSAGCGMKKAGSVAPSPTPVPTATPAPTATPTPEPTPTPVPKMIGTQTASSKQIPTINGINNEMKEIYLRTTGTEDWGANLLNGITVTPNEQAQFCYTPVSEEGGELYDIRLVGNDGAEYLTVSLDLADMSQMQFYLDETGEAYVKYQSISKNKEIDTKFGDVDTDTGGSAEGAAAGGGYTDASGKQYDAAGNVIYGYDESGNPIYGTDNYGNIIYGYDIYGNAIFGYDVNGNPIYTTGTDSSYVDTNQYDAAGNVIYGYDYYGNPIYGYDQYGNAVLGYNENGYPIVGYDSQGTPVYGYDEYGNPIYYY